MAKILVVDDEVNIRRMIRKFAEFEDMRSLRPWMAWTPWKNAKA